MFTNQFIQTLTVYALPVLFAITLHEAAHGYMAKRLGDPTAHLLGRVTLNPLNHIDLLGTIILPIVTYLATGGHFLFGYAKPVPLVFSNLRRPRQHTALVATAGPAANFIQAFLWQFFGLLLEMLQVSEPFFLKMAAAGVLVNLVVAFFNLLPIPPLDGGRIFAALLPPQQGAKVAQIEPYGLLIVVVLAATGLLGQFWLFPLVQWGHRLVSSTSWLFSIF